MDFFNEEGVPTKNILWLVFLIIGLVLLFSGFKVISAG